MIPGKNTEDGDLGFYNLGRFDDAHLKPGAFIGMHPHKNDEILTLMRSGTMLHKDSAGNEVAVTPQHIMLMNAGSGIYHEEGVPAERYRDDVRLLQIFIRPEFENEPSRVQFADPGKLISNRWRLVAGLKESGAPLEINSRIAVYDMEAENGLIGLPAAYFANPVYFIYVFNGGLTVKNKSLHQGDSVILDDPAEVLTVADAGTVVCFVIDKDASYTRSGMYSGMNR